MSDNMDMPLEPERTHGYVVRWRVDGDWLYHGETSVVGKLDGAEIRTLKHATDIARGYPNGVVEIVRVRCVEGEETTRLATKEEAVRFRYGYQTGETIPFAQNDGKCGDLYVVIPPPQRWEIDPEDDNG